MESAENYKKFVTDWVERALEKRNFEKIKIQFPKSEDGAEYGGAMAEISYINVSAEKNGKKETIPLLIKKNKDSEAALDTLNLRIIYENEVELYSKLVPYFEKFAKEKNAEIFENIPKCYDTIYKKNQYVIMMENLKPKGFKMHNIKVPIDLKHAKLVLEAYAKWHAFSFALKDQKRTEIFKKFQEGGEELPKAHLWTYMGPTMEKELNFVLDMYKERKNEKMIAKMEEMIKNIGKQPEIEENQEFFVVRHGDCWHNNFLFHYNGNEENPDKVVIIDWQMGVWGPPLADVTQFLFYGCSRKELEHLDELLKFYYENLSKKIRELGSDPEKCFPWNACVEMFKKYAPESISEFSMIAKMSFRPTTGGTYDITDVLRDGDYCAISGELADPEGFFERVNGVLELCIEKQFI